MTSEEDFQRMLDAKRNDHATRLVFADWLQDRDDPRAEGYRALGEFARSPMSWNDQNHWNCDDDLRDGRSWLPHIWLAAIQPVGEPYSNGRLFWPQHPTVESSRKQAEDAAALAWGALSEEERQQCREEMAKAVAV